MMIEVFDRMKRFAQKIAAAAAAFFFSTGVMGGNDSEARHKESGDTKVIERYSNDKGIEPNPVSVKLGRHLEQNDKPQRNSFKPSKIMHRWKVESKDVGGTLLFSDSPEYVDRDGILYTDTVEGEARILYYHLNNTHQPKKLAVIIEALSEDPTTVEVTRGGAAEPSDDYLTVGKITQTRYFSDAIHDRIYLLPGMKRFLREDMGLTVLHPGQLVYGVYDFKASQPVKVSVIMYPATADPFTFIDRAPILPKDEQCLRGTFQGMNRVITSRIPYDGARDGIVYIPLADNEHDLYMNGVDATDGSGVTNYGNYGVLYKIALPTTGRTTTQYYLSPLGGVYAGAMTAIEGNKSNLILTPPGRIYFGDATLPEPESVRIARNEGLAILTDNTELTDLGRYKNHANISFEYSPPGASNLPVMMVLMPTDK